MNSSLVTADRSTHLKIAAIALLTGMLVIWIGISTRATMTIWSPPSSVHFEPVANQIFIR